MKRLKRNYLPLLILFTSTVLSREPEIQTSYAYAQGGESLSDFLHHQVGIPYKTLHEKGYLNKIKKWNPAIENYNSLRPNERVYIELPYRTLLQPKKEKQFPELSMKKDSRKTIKKRVSDPSSRKIASLSSSSSLNQSIQLVEFQKKHDPLSWNLSVFYTLSRGSFEEGIQNSNIKTVSTQDSPITLGMATSKLINDNWGYNGSLYLSKLDGGISELEEEVSLPWEYGVTSYLSYRSSNWPVQIYSGFDYERFSSYNTSELINGASLESIQHNVGFLTLGLSKGFRFLGKSFFSKVSYSRSLYSTQSRDISGSDDSLSGSKYMAYLNMLANENWYYHAFFKQHNLKGATELTIARTGVGFGYRF
tara:strand:- start:151726 stop:152817 length:1092 start_codon:yes stop_codon:yes gene_type:complete